MENRLIGMTDFVLERSLKDISEFTITEAFKNGAKVMNEIFSYANFLKQPLKLEMFVPCDDDGNVLEEKIIYSKEEGCVFDSANFDKYENAKSKVLFEGFEFTESQKYSVNNKIKLSVSPYGLKDEKLSLTKLNDENKFHTWFQLFTIEDLVQCDLILTPNAIKKFKL